MGKNANNESCCSINLSHIGTFRNFAGGGCLIKGRNFIIMSADGIFSYRLK